MTWFKILVTIHGKIWSFLSVYPSLYMFLHQNLMANSKFQHFNTNKPLEKSIFKFFVQCPPKCPKSKIFVYFANLVYLGRTGALGMPKMSHVIDKTGVCKLHAAIWDFFHFSVHTGRFSVKFQIPPR